MAFSLTKRMSEDVDLRIQLADPPTSRSAQKKQLGQIKREVGASLTATFPGSLLVRSGNENRYMDFNIAYPLPAR
jgi:hypothetical protein